VSDTLKFAVRVAWIAALVAVLPGCLLVAVGAGAGAAAAGTAYVMGDLEATLEATPTQIVSATRGALADMDIAMISAASTDLDGEVRARTATDEKVTIKVRSQTRRLSDVSIRVGTFGDETFSRRILEEIRGNLPEQPAKQPD